VILIERKCPSIPSFLKLLLYKYKQKYSFWWIFTCNALIDLLFQGAIFEPIPYFEQVSQIANGAA
jgi:hypothetical protein